MDLCNRATESDVLARVGVRLVPEDEVGQFNYYLSRSITLRAAGGRASRCGMWPRRTGNASRC